MTAFVGCISRGQEVEYRSVVDRLVEWCELNHLQLNVSKTKELVARMNLFDLFRPTDN